MCYQKMYTYILLVDDHDEVAMYLPSTKKLVSTNNKQTKVIEEVVSPTYPS